MSQGGDAADMLVRESIEVTESAVKLAALGAKNLAALLIAIAKKDERSLSGVTDILRMFQDGSVPKVISIETPRVKQFLKVAKDYKLPYKPIKDKASGMTDIVFRESDLSMMLRIMERAGITVPVQADARDAKNGTPRAQSESRSTGRGDGSKASMRPERTTDPPKKESVKLHIESYKQAQADERSAARSPRIESLLRANRAMSGEGPAVPVPKSPAKGPER